MTSQLAEKLLRTTALKGTALQLAEKVLWSFERARL
jgi:hypothetical protein